VEDRDAAGRAAGAVGLGDLSWSQVCPVGEMDDGTLSHAQTLERRQHVRVHSSFHFDCVEMHHTNLTLVPTHRHTLSEFTKPARSGQSSLGDREPRRSSVDAGTARRSARQELFATDVRAVSGRQVACG
jgi:hypothetical protein